MLEISLTLGIKAFRRFVARSSSARIYRGIEYAQEYVKDESLFSILEV